MLYFNNHRIFIFITSTALFIICYLLPSGKDIHPQGKVQHQKEIVLEEIKYKKERHELRNWLEADIRIRIRNAVIRIEITETCIRTVIRVTAYDKCLFYQY